jgi:hypothetical protein
MVMFCGYGGCSGFAERDVENERQAIWKAKAEGNKLLEVEGDIEGMVTTAF